MSLRKQKAQIYLWHFRLLPKNVKHFQNNTCTLTYQNECVNIKPAAGTSARAAVTENESTSTFLPDSESWIQKRHGIWGSVLVLNNGRVLHDKDME